MRRLLLVMAVLLCVATSSVGLFTLWQIWKPAAGPAAGPAVSPAVSPAATPESTPGSTPASPEVRRPVTETPAWLTEVPELEKRLGGQIGIAIAPMGGAAAVSGGSLPEQVAWSTSKVPVAIAAIRKDGMSDGLAADLRRAITVSDNDAAEALYRRLGNPKMAATQIEQVLSDGGNPEVKVPVTRQRSGFTIFGQTKWSVADQAIFAANLPCIAQAEPVLSQMQQVTGGQRWGLGQIPKAAFKGGWGPVAGGYLVRQFGIVTVGGHQAGVAIMTLRPSFEQGQSTLTSITEWLDKHGSVSAPIKCELKV